MDSSSLAQMTPAQLAKTPAGIPPPGVTPDLIHPPSDGYKFIIVGTLFLMLMSVFASLRVYVKLFVVRRTTIDDYTLALGVLGAILYYVICIYSVTEGKIGTHIWDISVGFLFSDEFLIPSFLSNLVTSFVWTLVKISFLIFYSSLFRPFIWLRYSIYITIGLTVGFYLTIIIITICFTAPLAGQTWAEAFLSPRYTRIFSWAIPIAAGSLVLDTIILLLPMLGVAKLKLNTARKFGVMCMFLTGLLACICSSLSVYYKYLLTQPAGEADFSWAVEPVLIMSFLEMSIGISAACMPSIVQLKSKKSFTWSKLRKNSITNSLRSLFGSKSEKSMYPSNSSEHIVSHEQSIYGKVETQISVTSDSKSPSERGRKETWGTLQV